MLLASICAKLQLRDVQQDGIAGEEGSTGMRGDGAGEASRSCRAGNAAARGRGRE